MTGSPLRRLAARVVDRLVLVVLVVLASVPLVTGFAALTAAATVLAGPDDARSVPRLFWAALRRRPARAMLVQLLVLAALAVAVADLLFATGSALNPGVRSVVAAPGAVLLLAVLTVPPYAAVLAARRSGGSAAALLRDGAALALGRPVSSVGALLLGACLAAWAPALPALTPFLAGVAVLGSLSLADGALRRLPGISILPVPTPEEVS